MSAWAPGGGRRGRGPGPPPPPPTLKGNVSFYAADDNGRLEYEAQVSASQSRFFFHKAS